MASATSRREISLWARRSISTRNVEGRALNGCPLLGGASSAAALVATLLLSGLLAAGCGTDEPPESGSPSNGRESSADGQALSADGQALSSDGQALPSDGQDISPDERDLVPWEPEVLWARGGIEDDTVLFGPWSVRGAEGQVLVLDWGGHRVRAFDLATGDVRWSFGRRGEGPGEFQNPVDMLPLADGRTVVWDTEVGRLTWVSEDGRLGKMLNVNTVSRPNRFCELAGGTLVALHATQDAALSALTDRGTLDALGPLPWTTLTDLDALQRQAEFATGPGGDCVFYLTQSTGFVRVDEEGFGVPHKYVEDMGPPPVVIRENETTRSTRLGEYQLAVNAGFIRGGEVWLAFHGLTPRAGRLIDVFDLETGGYLRSYELPWPITGLGAAEDRVFFLRSVDGYPVLVAARAPTS